jgi:membrane-associated phospholipid phosphatase
VTVRLEATHRGLRRDPERSAWLVIVLVLLVVFTVLGLAARSGHVFRWDTTILRFLYGREQVAQGSALDRAAGVIVDFGGNTTTLLVGLASLAVLLARRKGPDALFVAATGVAVLTLTPLFKEVFERTELKYSFPSGNAARSAAVVAAAVFIAWPTRFRWPTLLIGIALTGVLGTALVYENWHLPSDVIGGWCLGIACAALLHEAVPRRPPRPSRA